MTRQVEYIIVGQGLAGTWLSFLLSKEKKSLLLVDQALPGAASKVAGGLFSPLAGKRAAPIWRAAELLELAAQLYPLLQKHIGFRVYYQQAVVRVFKDADQRRQWVLRAQDKATARWLSPNLHLGTMPDCIKAPHGAMRVNNTGYVHVPRLINKYRDAAKKEGWLIEEVLDPAELKFDAEGVSWRDVQAKKIIFCDGHRARGNPWFGKLPFQPTKGEVISVKLDDMVLRRIFQKEYFLLPYSDHTLRVGATYDREDLTYEPTAANLKKLALGTADLVDLNMDVIAHDMGIRPNLLGHFPVAGMHPQYPQIGILNGLGSKGVLFAPFCAANLTSHLVHGTALPKEIDLARFYKTPI